MKLRHLIFKVTENEANQRLDHTLHAWLNASLKMEISKQKTRTLIMAGAVYLNKKRVKIASKPLFKGATVEAYVNPEKLFSNNEIKEKKEKLHSKIEIIHEDEHLIIVHKPEGLPTQPTIDESRMNLFDAVKKLIAKRESIQDPYLGLHHRLDRDTSGLLLLTKTKKANPGVAKLFSEHLIQKTYIARTHIPKSKLDDRFEVSNFLKKAKERKNKKAFFESVHSGGQKAITEFEVLERQKDSYLVQAKPKTGRTHQIRVHLSELGIPILGDELYGKKTEIDKKYQRMCLHAWKLEFTHPIKKTPITVESNHHKRGFGI